MANPNEREVSIVIRARDDAGTAINKFLTSLTSLKGAAIAAAAAFAGFAVAFTKITQAAIQQENADVRLAVALASVGQNTDATRKRLGAFAKDLQDATTVNDEAIQDLVATLIQLGGVGVDQVERVARATVDLAAITGKDLTSAGLLMAKAAQGQTESLAHYGIVLDESIPKTQRFTALLGLLEKNEGTAAERSKTLEGALRRIGNDWDDLLQTIGQSITQSQVFRDLMASLSTILKDAATAIDANRDAVDIWVDAIARSLIGVLSLGRGVAFLGVAFSSAANPISAFLESMGLLEEGTTDLRRSLQVEAGIALDKFQSSLDRLKKTLDEVGPSVKIDVAAGIKNFGNAAGEAAGKLGPLDEALKKLGLTTLKDAREQAEGIAAAFNLALQTVGKEGGPTEEEFEALNKQLGEMAKRLEEMSGVHLPGLAFSFGHIISLTKQLERDLSEGAVGAALQFGDALVDAAFGASVSFKQVFKQILADLAKAIARALILRALFSFGGGVGAVAGQAAGIVTAQHGGEVRGGRRGLDSVLAALQPGEIVLPASLNQDFRELAEVVRRSRDDRSGLPGMPLTIHNTIVPGSRREDAIALIGEMTRLVEDFGFRLTASELVEG